MFPISSLRTLPSLSSSPSSYLLHATTMILGHVTMTLVVIDGTTCSVKSPELYTMPSDSHIYCRPVKGTDNSLDNCGLNANHHRLSDVLLKTLVRVVHVLSTCLTFFIDVPLLYDAPLAHPLIRHGCMRRLDL